MNLIWTLMFITSTLIYVINGKPGDVMTIIYNSSDEILRTIKIIGINICLWTGIINILKETSIVNRLKKYMCKLINIIFKNEKNKLDDEDYENISLNIISNMLGIGNAATASGLKEMKKIKKEKNKKDIAEKFVILNSASIQIIPFTMLSIRTLNGAKKNNIVFPVIINSFVALLAGIYCYNRLKKYD